MKPIELKYSLCHPAGCTAETEATKDITDQMAAGGGIMVLAMNAAAQPVAFPVPLDGYNEAAAGKPVDNAEYAKARGALMRQIRQRQQQMAEKFKADQMKNLPTSGPGAPPKRRPVRRRRLRLLRRLRRSKLSAASISLETALPQGWGGFSLCRAPANPAYRSPDMSRAFVKDDDGGEGVEELPDRLISPHPNLVTRGRAGADRGRG